MLRRGEPLGVVKDLILTTSQARGAGRRATTKGRGRSALGQIRPVAKGCLAQCWRLFAKTVANFTKTINIKRHADLQNGIIETPSTNERKKWLLTIFCLPVCKVGLRLRQAFRR